MVLVSSILIVSANFLVVSYGYSYLNTSKFTIPEKVALIV